MKQKYILPLLVLFITACKKEKLSIDPQPDWKGTRLVDIFEVHYNTYTDTTYKHFEYNKDGYLTTYTVRNIYYDVMLNSYQSTTSRMVFVRDHNNRILHDSVLADGTSASGSYVYNTKGKVYQIHYTDLEGGTPYLVDYTYNGNKVATISFAYEADKREVSFNYNSSGNITSATQTYTTITGSTVQTFTNITHDNKANYAAAVGGSENPYLLFDLSPEAYGTNNVLSMTMATARDTNHISQDFTYNSMGYPTTMTYSVNDTSQYKAIYTYQTN